MTTHLIRGDDPILVGEAVSRVVDDLVGTHDRSLVVDELDAARYETDGGRSIAALVDAAQTPPFLTEQRVVVGRQLGAFTKADDVAALVAYLADPLETTRLVLVWEPHPTPQVRSGHPPKSLLTAIKGAGGTLIDTGVGAKADAWVTEQLSSAPVQLDRAARDMVVDRLGEDASRVVGLLRTLEGVYGEGARLGPEEVAPYLGDEGGVKPWDLTDAIDRGDLGASLDRLHRLLDGSGQHPLQVLATLQHHVLRMVALDGLDVPDEKAAAAVLGMKGSTFPARKALQQGRRLGPARLADFVGLLARADLDVRGASALDDRTVMEILVARLASRTPKAGGGGASRRGARR